MVTVGIICEYNPFHNGHLYQIQKVRERFGDDCAVVAIMSGSFVQRGEGAITDKWSRAKVAVLAGGVNVVIELPAFYATATAEIFADGAVACVAATGLCDYLVFGSEYEDIRGLEKIAKILAFETDDYKIILKNYLSKGFSYPASVSAALSEYSPGLDADKILHGSNNILAIEYLKALYRRNIRTIRPVSIKRMGQDYSDCSVPEDKSLRSASSIRFTFEKKGMDLSGIIEDLHSSMPVESLAALALEYKEGNCIVSREVFADMIISKLLVSDRNELNLFEGMSEGLGSLLKKHAGKLPSGEKHLEELINISSSKRYTSSRIRRSLVHMLLGITKEDTLLFNNENGPLYLRVLAFDKKGRYVLKLMRKSASLPIIMKGSDFLEYPNTPPNTAIRRMSELDRISTDIRELKTSGRIGRDFTTPPISFQKRPKR